MAGAEQLDILLLPASQVVHTLAAIRFCLSVALVWDEGDELSVSARVKLLREVYGEIGRQLDKVRMLIG